MHFFSFLTLCGTKLRKYYLEYIY